jgi:hypothetical protein
VTAATIEETAVAHQEPDPPAQRVSQAERAQRMATLQSTRGLDIDETAAVLGVKPHRLKMMIREQRLFDAACRRARAEGRPEPVPTVQQLRNMWPESTVSIPPREEGQRVRRGWLEGMVWAEGIAKGRIDPDRWQPIDITGLDGGRRLGSANAEPTEAQQRRQANRDLAVSLYLMRRKLGADQLTARRQALEDFNSERPALQTAEITYEYLCSLLQEAARNPADYPGLAQQDQAA